MKIIGILILAIYQVALALKWLAQMAWWLLVILPLGIWRDAQRWRQHECPKSQSQPVEVDAFIPDSQPAPEPVGNTDEGDKCYWCDHRKMDHADAFACRHCDCQSEQYSTDPSWHPGDPLPYRVLIAHEDGSLEWVKEYA